MKHAAFVLAALCVVVAAAAVASYQAAREDRAGDAPPTGGQCRGSCSAIDPVMEPAYNMINVCKQSVLLEEHLNNEKKRCRDCCKKHFLHIVGLAEEAVSLAGTDPARADPLIARAAQGYDRLMQSYLAGGDPLEVAAGCRDLRKKLMDKYVQ